MSLHLFHAPALPAFLSQMESIWEQALADPLEPEWLICDNGAVRAWFEYAATAHLGVLPPLRWWSLAELDAHFTGHNRHLPPQRQWDILGLLCNTAFTAEDESWQAILPWLVQDSSRTFALAQRLAERFEAYRRGAPEMLLAWERELPLEGHARWQALLWRALQTQMPDPVPVALPERLMLLAPAYLGRGDCQRLAQWGQQSEIWVFFLQVSEHPAGDVLGQQGRWQTHVFEQMGWHSQVIPWEMPPSEVRFIASGDAYRQALALRDRALQAEVCAEPEKMGFLVYERADISLIPALFTQHGPWPLAVQVLSPRGPLPSWEAPLRTALLKGWSLSQGRLTLPDVLDWLALPVVRQSWGLSRADLDLCRHWLEAVAVRWGQDRTHREGLTGIAFDQNSWTHGLRRLVVGYILGEDYPGLYADLLPYTEIEGSLAPVLSRLLAVLDGLFEMLPRLQAEQTPEEWALRLGAFLHQLCRPVDLNEACLVGESLQRLRRISRFYAGKVPLSWVKTILQQDWQAQDQPCTWGSALSIGHFEACAVLPWEWVGLTGLNPQRFPPQTVPLEFDVLPEGALPDAAMQMRQALLFLLTRPQVFLSWQGYTLDNGHRQSPPLLLSQLMALLDKSIEFDPLLPYDPLALSALAPLRADPSERDSLRVLWGQQVPEPLRGIPPAKSQVSPQHCDVEYWLRFWRSPLAFYLQERCALRLQASPEKLSEDEPFEPHSLQRFQDRQFLWEGLQAQVPEGELLAQLQANGHWPVGALGAVQLAQNLVQVQAFDAALKTLVLPEVDLQGFEVRLSAGLITGTLAWGQDKIALVRLGRVRPVDRWLAWLQHLLRGALASPAETWVIGQEEQHELQVTRYLPLEVQDAHFHLEALWSAFQEGQNAPLAFFPGASLAYAASWHAEQDEEAALWAAREAWLGTYGEGSQSLLRLCYPEPPFDHRFQHWAQELALPLWALSEPVS